MSARLNLGPDFFCRKIDSRQEENSLQKKYFSGTNLVEEKNKLVGREEEI